jgi:hypothetical protein
MMPEEDLTPYPSQAELNEMVLAAVVTTPLGQPVIVARDGDDLTPAMTQAQNDLAMLVACGPPPGSQAPMNIDVPFVEGAGTVGGTLTCTMGNWTGMDAEPHSYAYQWMSDGESELGTGESYTAVASDSGTSITCVVTATNANGSTAAPPSNAVVVNGGARSRAKPPAEEERRAVPRRG